MQSNIAYHIDKQSFQDNFPDDNSYRKLFVIPLAHGLYKSILKSDSKTYLPNKSDRDFQFLTKSEKSFWYSFAEAIPAKYEARNLFIRLFENFCRTCIITDDEITSFAMIDKETLIPGRTMQNKITDLHGFLTQLNYFIPGELKTIGYEVVRYEEVLEINFAMIRKLAKAIHSRYMHEIRHQRNNVNNSVFFNSPELYISDFEDLPEDIKNSNIDNAAHIPTKLLSIGYKIRQVRKGFRPFALHLNEGEIETMARVEHLRWGWEKRLNGWIYGNIKDDFKRTHPSLVPYELLNESEKGKDRELVRLIPAFLKDINFEAFPVSPNRIKKLSYSIKPQSSIHRILEETRELNEQIKSLVSLTPGVEEIVRVRNKKIEDAIKEVEGSYNYAQHIQETYLPDDFYVRETFPDSFILFKPKDIVSGDFYFFSRKDDKIIFAVADCTGHGIPGAMLSTLGYGILDQAVNEIGITEPGAILHHLYSKIHRYLRYDSEGSGISDDMDIVLCILDVKTNVLTYSAVKNSLYCITKGELNEYPAQNSSDDKCKTGDCNFKSTKIQLKISDVIYLFSDGYIDQLGGKRHKRYQTTKFKNFLQGLQRCSLSEQSDKLYEELEKWREEDNEDQTDDILVVGIKI